MALTVAAVSKLTINGGVHVDIPAALVDELEGEGVDSCREGEEGEELHVACRVIVLLEVFLSDSCVA